MKIANNTSAVNTVLSCTLSIVACLLIGLLNIGSAAAKDDQFADGESAGSSMISVSVTASHEMSLPSVPCEKHTCKKFFKCESSCVVGGNCAPHTAACNTSYLTHKPQMKAERLFTALSVALEPRGADSLFRPPIR